MQTSPFLTAFTFQVNPRFVGTNPTDPHGLRRSQRAVLDLTLATTGCEAIHPSRLLAFHAPTGAGKSHLLRKLSAENQKFTSPRKLIYTFPIHALVNQQASAVGASRLDAERLFQKIKEEALADPKSDSALIYNTYMKTCVLPPEFRRGTLVSDILATDVTTPVAITPDVLDLAVKGIMVGTMPLKGGKDASKRVKTVLRSFMKGRLTHEASQKTILAIQKVVEPKHISPKTPHRIWKIIRRALAPLNKPLPPGTTPEDIRNISERLADLVTPLERDSAPGPKYAFSTEVAESLRAILATSIVVFDEYHLLAKYPHNFRKLISRLRHFGATVLLMSGTPRMDFLEAASGAKGDYITIDFDDFEAPELIEPYEPVVVFNHPMQITLRKENFADGSYNPAPALAEAIQHWDTAAPGPMAAIFESKARALSVREAFLNHPVFRDRVYWWTGPEKDPKMLPILAGESPLPKDAIVIGTSALELGVDLPFRNAWMECLHHESLIQRIGRIGRMGTSAPNELHHAIVLVRKSLPNPEFFHTDPDGEKRGPVERHQLDQLLQDYLGLPDHRADELTESIWFRGNRQAQCLAIVPNEAGGWKTVRGPIKEMLRIYPVARIPAEDWGGMSLSGKRDLLRAAGIDSESAMQAIWGENFAPSTTAYIATGLDASPRRIEGPEVVATSPRGNKCIVRYTCGGKEIFRPTIPVSSAPKHAFQTAEPAKSAFIPGSGPLSAGIKPKARRGITILTTQTN